MPGQHDAEHHDDQIEVRKDLPIHDAGRISMCDGPEEKQGDGQRDREQCG